MFLVAQIFTTVEFEQDDVVWSCVYHLVPSCCATMNGWSLPELPSPEKKKNASTSIFSLQLGGTEVKTGLAHGQKAQEFNFLMFFLVGGNWSQNWVVGV